VRNIIERALIFFPNAIVSAEDVRNYLLKIKDDIVDRKIEQEAIWSEIDSFRQTSNEVSESIEQNPLPTPKDFSNWFSINNSVDLRVLLRDIEIVMIQAALDRNRGNTSEAAKDLKLLRTTLIEKIKKYAL